jgi:hypothetical protein
VNSRAAWAPPLSGPIRQIGYVVRDFDEAMAEWVAMGVGPWYVVRNRVQHAVYRGEPIEVTISVGFANSGDLQVELIHQHCETPSIFTEFLGACGGGFHQLAWWVTNFDHAVAAAEATGWPVVWSGGEDTATRFAYLEPPAAAGWDGADPVRTLGA